MHRPFSWCALFVCVTMLASPVAGAPAGSPAGGGSCAGVLDSRTIALDGAGGLVRSSAVLQAPRVVIGEGALSRQAAARLEVLREAPVAPPNRDARVTGPVAQLTLRTASLADDAQLEVRSAGSVPQGEVALLGYERDGVWIVDEATPIDGGLRAVVPLVETTGGSSGRGEGETSLRFALLSIEPAVRVDEPAIETYRLQDGGWAAYDGVWKEVAGERVALMVHGFMGGTREDLLPLARELLNQPGYRYDKVYAIEWHEGYGIERIGARLAGIIKERVSAGQIDVFAHSMGGLVARGAIELCGAAEKVNILVTMGTPHLGHSRASLLSFLVMRSPSWAAELRDLERGSGFLKKLNQPSGTPCAYRLLAGDSPSRPHVYWTVPLWGLMAGANDGMVETASAAADLKRECASYAVKVERLNHAGIRTDGAVFDDIRAWLLDLYGGDRQGLDGSPLVWVPAGEFGMGADDGQEDMGGYWQASRPVHRVRITQGFWIGKCEVTNAQFAQFLTAHGSNTDAEGHMLLRVQDAECRIRLADGVFSAEPGWGQHPVASVTWYGARAYCERYGLSLPTEAEWEYAARGPQNRDYPWGSGWDVGKVAAGSAASVGSLPQGASWCGALDMAGGVWEWCEDWFSTDYYAASPAEDPQGPETGTLSVLRGGSGSLSGRSAYRYPCDRDQASHAGFRPVLRGGE